MKLGCRQCAGDIEWSDRVSGVRTSEHFRVCTLGAALVAVQDLCSGVGVLASLGVAAMGALWVAAAGIWDATKYTFSCSLGSILA